MNCFIPQAVYPEAVQGEQPCSTKVERLPAWPCFGWGLPCSAVKRNPKRDRQCYHYRGRLLPCHFTLIPLTRDGIFSAALSVVKNLRF